MSLRFQFDRQGNVLPAVRTESFGAPIYDKGEVEERLRGAQERILHASSSDSDSDDSFNITEASFSRNVIVLDISGPDVVDLSFVDLPGEHLHHGSFIYLL